MGLRRFLGLRKDDPSFVREAASTYGRRVGRLKIERGQDYSLVRFENEQGFDYEAYRQIQTVTNKSKIERVTVEEKNIAYLCDYLTARDARIHSVLCHGTRNAAEQRFFRANLPEARIIGTEISDTAEKFPMTIQWDFHEVKPEWIGAFDVVFSNSWDHSYDPNKLFPAWLSCVAPGGALVLEWSEFNHPNRGFRTWFERFTPLWALAPTTVSDPLRMSLAGLLRLLGQHADREYFAAPEILHDLPSRKSGQVFVVTRRLVVSGRNPD